MLMLQITKMMEISTNTPNMQQRFLKNFDQMIAACMKIRENLHQVNSVNDILMSHS